MLSLSHLALVAEAQGRELDGAKALPTTALDRG
jgi:hypothetical protein